MPYVTSGVRYVFLCDRVVGGVRAGGWKLPVNRYLIGMKQHSQHLTIVPVSVSIGENKTSDSDLPDPLSGRTVPAIRQENPEWHTGGETFLGHLKADQNLAIVGTLVAVVKQL